MTITASTRTLPAELHDDARETIRAAALQMLIYIGVDGDGDDAPIGAIGDLLRLAAISAQIGQVAIGSSFPPLREKDVEGLRIAVGVMRDLSEDYTDEEQVGSTCCAFYTDVKARAERVWTWIDGEERSA
jgi:hypothetical protein